MILSRKICVVKKLGVNELIEEDRILRNLHGNEATTPPFRSTFETLTAISYNTTPFPLSVDILPFVTDVLMESHYAKIAPFRIWH